MLILLVLTASFLTAQQHIDIPVPMITLQLARVAKDLTQLIKMAPRMKYPHEISKHTTALQRGQLQVKCCEKIIKHTADLLQHYQENHMAAYFACDQCGGLFISKHQHNNSKQGKEQCRKRAYKPRGPYKKKTEPAIQVASPYPDQSYKHTIKFLVN